MSYNPEKTRELQVRLDADVNFEYWNELYAWLVTGLLKLRSVVGLLENSSLVGA